jgi:hypothetical protein
MSIVRLDPDSAPPDSSSGSRGKAVRCNELGGNAPRGKKRANHAPGAAELARGALGHDEHGYRAEFVRLLDESQRLAGVQDDR